MAESLEFAGRYAKGATLFSKQIQIPGQCEITKIIDGWPASVYPGTMNVRIDPGGFPHALISRFGTKSVKDLDSRLFRPITEIPAHAIGATPFHQLIHGPIEAMARYGVLRSIS